MIPALFALFAFAWPLYTQKPFSSDEIQIVCASKIYTSNTETPRAECLAFSRLTGLFTSVGTRRQVLGKHPNASIRELGPNITVLPGLYDSHGHVMHYGDMLQNINLFGADTFQGRAVLSHKNIDD